MRRWFGIFVHPIRLNLRQHSRALLTAGAAVALGLTAGCLLLLGHSTQRALVGSASSGVLSDGEVVWWSWRGHEGPHISLGAAAAVSALLCLICVRAKKDTEQREQMRGVICLQCGYDLCGNESGICPECGTPI